MVALFSLTLLLSASLLFCIEPMVAKMLLPQMGGVPAVWDACLVFFQLTLLAGYAFSHFTLRALGPRRQAPLQIAMAVVVFLALPISMDAGAVARFTELGPALRAIVLLAIGAGAPFFVLSTMAPTLQRWFSMTGNEGARDPYFLYAASNLGSIGALAAYPLLIETRVGLAAQSRAMRVVYGLLVVLAVACALAMRRAPDSLRAPVHAKGVVWKRRARWVLLATVPSAQLLALTTYMTTEIAPAPLLWAIPLATYLLSFVVVFSKRGAGVRGWVARALPFTSALIVYMLAIGATNPPILALSIHLTAFFVASLYCHGELAADRPAPSQLPEFYLWMSTGGALGGMAIALGAPALLSRPIEYPITILFALACRGGGSGGRSDWKRVALVTACGVAVAVACHKLPLPPAALKLLPGIPLLVAFTLEAAPLPFAFAMAIVIMSGVASQERVETEVAHERSFFGSLSVLHNETKHTMTLLHGNTIHGVQLASEPRRPAAYYSRSGPAGDVFAVIQKDSADLHVAVVGLGTGTLAAYARPDEHWRFFEIDPAVANIARDARYFTFLQDAFPGGADIVLGDARLEIAHANGGYDLLVIDAFSSDAIPVHLLTREAFALYRTKLAPGAKVLWHISNRYLDLEPVLAALAHDAGWQAMLRDDDVAESQTSLKIGSIWAIMSADDDEHMRTLAARKWVPLRSRPGFSPWTDDRTAILSVLRP